MDWIKLLAAIGITIAGLSLVYFVAWLCDKTDGWLFLILLFIAIVAAVYCSI